MPRGSGFDKDGGREGGGRAHGGRAHHRAAKVLCLLAMWHSIVILVETPFWHNTQIYVARCNPSVLIYN